MKNIQRNKKDFPFLRSILTPVLFELCGTIPLLLVALGLMSISSGVALRNVLIYQYTFVFFIVAAGLFTLSIYAFLKQRNACSVSGLRQYRKPIISALFLLLFAEALVLFIIEIAEQYVYNEPLNMIGFVNILSTSAIIVVLLLFLFFKHNRIGRL